MHDEPRLDRQHARALQCAALADVSHGVARVSYTYTHTRVGPHGRRHLAQHAHSTMLARTRGATRSSPGSPARVLCGQSMEDQ